MSEKIIHGDARTALAEIEDCSVHCCVTSPPYWGLRAYVDDPREIGREETPEQHLANLVDVFREVRRVLRDDGTLWLNYGDAYATSPAGNVEPCKDKRGPGSYRRANNALDTKRCGYKPKDLLSMPFRVVEALRQDGWYHRSTIIWSKKSPMPESVRGTRWERCRVQVGGQSEEIPKSHGKPGGTTGHGMPHGMDERFLAQWQPCPGCPKCEANGGYILRMNAGRPTTSHEYVFLLTKSASYFYNQDGNRVEHSRQWWTETVSQQPNFNRKDGGSRQSDNHSPAGRNLWTVWSDIKQSKYKGAHFATMPLELALRCVKLGTSDYGCCPTCGDQWAPVVETDREPTRPATNNKRSDAFRNSERYIDQDGPADNALHKGNVDAARHETSTSIKEWRPACKCEVNDGGRPVVLDPFHGSGTTGEAARECGCDYVGVELHDEYIKLSKKRFEQSLLI